MLGYFAPRRVHREDPSRRGTTPMPVCLVADPLRPESASSASRAPAIPEVRRTSPESPGCSFPAVQSFQAMEVCQGRGERFDLVVRKKQLTERAQPLPEIRQFLQGAIREDELA